MAPTVAHVATATSTAPTLGVFLPTLADASGALGDVTAAARHAESVGLESAWAVDQLVTGSGVALLDSTVSLAAAAGATERILLGFGVLIVPLRRSAWLAKQVGTLQHVSGGRVLLGVGLGGARHDTSWAALGRDRVARGRFTDEVLDALPAQLRGQPTVPVDGLAGARPVQLLPAVAPPPLLVGGNAGAARRRAVRVGADWFPAVLTEDELRAGRVELAELAAARSVPVPATTLGVQVVMTDDRTVPSAPEVLAALAGPSFGIPEGTARATTVQGSVDQVAERLAGLHAAGARRVVATLAFGDWFRQAELLAEAARRAVGVQVGA
jgi:alkanesulfonate monooxygenase SsuD/methylene tetrahydromethanopterin reductase-like flavin-dependent oxidoreductase (luciferase family)